jgi:hypothetical protein
MLYPTWRDACVCVISLAATSIIGIGAWFTVPEEWFMVAWFGTVAFCYLRLVVLHLLYSARLKLAQVVVARTWP